MLYFVHPPDPPFSALLGLTNELVTAGFRQPFAAKEYQRILPTIAPWWSPKQAGREWRWLWELQQRRQVYHVDDHHWALLFDALRLAIAGVNECTTADRRFPLGPIRIGVIDEELLIDSYFWHLRFLEKGFPAPAPGARQAQRVTRAAAWTTFDPRALYRADSTRYPDPRPPDDTRQRRDGELVSYRIPGLPELLDSRREAFLEKFGRDIGPGDPVFWDLDAEIPTPMSEAKLSAMMEEALAAAGFPAYGYVYRKLGSLVTEANLPSFSPEEIRAWHQALKECEREHGIPRQTAHPRR